MSFRLEKTDPKSAGRAGYLQTAHGQVPTPAFMPVGTLGAVKAVHLKDLQEVVRPDMVLSNTYHLYLRPGVEVLEAAGGLHAFSGWQGPILTDSGGYQVYSLSQIRKISEAGVRFQSHIDGSTHLFTPENVVDMQRSIGADVMMGFDECTPYPCAHDEARKSMERTHRWLRRGAARFAATTPRYGYEQMCFPIVQGSTYADLRKISAEAVAGMAQPGNAIGGLSVGEPAELMYQMTDTVCQVLPSDKPRYLMGVGLPENMLETIALGVDMFDCVIPTRNGRNGMLFTANGRINIKNKKWEKDFAPIDEEGPAFVSRQYSKAFLRHLMQSKEILALQIASIHNLAFFQWLVHEAHAQIMKGTFAAWKAQMVRKVAQRL